MELRGLELIKSYRENPGRYLPMLDFTGQMPANGEDGGVNIGWYAGMLDERRPFFAQCWALDHITMLTIYVSTEGIENMMPEDLNQWFQDIGYYRDKERQGPPHVDTVTNPKGQEFYCINIGVGIDDEPARIDGGAVWGWSILNKFNREQFNSDEQAVFDQ